MNGDGQMSDQEVGEELGRRMRAAVRPVDGAGFSLEELPASAPAPPRRRAALLVASGVAAAAAILALILVLPSYRDASEVRTGRVPSTLDGDVPCIGPGANGTIGYVVLNPVQGRVLVDAGISPEEGLDGTVTPGVLFGGEPLLLTAVQYEVLREGGEPITAAQLVEMGYDVDAGGPATTVSTTTTTPPSTTTLPEGTTPFEAWITALRERGLLTPEQEAEIAAGRGISLDGDQSAAIEEAFPSPEPPVNGPVASASTPGSAGGPPLCSEVADSSAAEQATAESAPGPATQNLDLLDPGESRPLASAPLSGRSTMASVWTGEEMIIWGGDSDDGQFDDGAAYDPRRDAWSPLPDGPLDARNAPAAVWTGTEVLLWGGHASSDDPASPNGIAYDDGAAYDPATGAWRTIAPAPMRSAGRPIAVWTGSEMVVLAGFNSADAAAYDPSTDRWRRLPGLPGQLQAPTPVAVWTGTEVVAVVADGTSTASGASIVALDPNDGGWTELPGQPPGMVALAWTGDRLVGAAGSTAFELRSGAWVEVASAPAGSSVTDGPTVWTGEALVQWNGDSAIAIDPEAGTWRAIPSGLDTQRIQPAAVWADGVLLAWGGFPDAASGVMVRPPE